MKRINMNANDNIDNIDMETYVMFIMKRIGKVEE